VDAVGYLWRAIAAVADPPQTQPLLVGITLLVLVIAVILAAGWRQAGREPQSGEERPRSLGDPRQMD
jgi:hypothetical protein